MTDNIAKIKKVADFLLKKRYWVLFIAFFIWIMFFDRNNIFKIIHYNKELSALKKQEDFLKQKILKDSAKITELKTNDETLEKFAREQYFFHKPNEIVFKIEQTQQPTTK
jgi:cell division protein FtsB